MENQVETKTDKVKDYYPLLGFTCRGQNTSFHHEPKTLKAAGAYYEHVLSIFVADGGIEKVMNTIRYIFQD